MSVRRCALFMSVLVLLAAGCARDETGIEGLAPAPEALPPVSVRGLLRLSAYTATPRRASAAPLVQSSVFVNDRGYHGMEDNDLRGFLDGRFRYGWNQPMQLHVRVGRWQHSARWGEYELFRVLYRWDDLDLPRDARVADAKVRLVVERGVRDDRPVTLLLYELRKDYEPGQGGTQGDNISPPKPGEVWWGERAHDEEDWGLPGAGFASDVHPDADTPAQALAEATWEKDQAEIVFNSPALAAYAERTVRSGEAMRMLLKLSDQDEDVRGTVVHLYSGNVGLDRNPARRPRLELDWSSPSQVAAAEHRIHLEHGRRTELPALSVRGADHVIVSFAAEDDSEPPMIAARRDGDRLAVELLAARDPVTRGETFQASFRDTWSPTAPPEDQDVRFTFVAPSGEVHERAARYIGDSRWEVAFEPDELGRWRYWFEHALEHPWRGADGVFDALPGDREAVARQLRSLAAAVRKRYSEEPKRSVYRFGTEFWRLERAAMASLTAAEWQQPEGREIDALIVDVRNAMGEKRLPEKLRLRAGKLHWKEREKEQAERRDAGSSGSDSPKPAREP